MVAPSGSHQGFQFEGCTAGRSKRCTGPVPEGAGCVQINAVKSNTPNTVHNQMWKEFRSHVSNQKQNMTEISEREPANSDFSQSHYADHRTGRIPSGHRTNSPWLGVNLSKSNVASIGNGILTFKSTHVVSLVTI